MISQHSDIRLDPRGVEERTQQIGLDLWKRARSAHQQLTSLNRWARQVLTWCLSDPKLKSHVLRFVDCLPSLTTPRAGCRGGRSPAG